MIAFLLLAALFEKIALIDSADFAHVMDVETRAGTCAIINHVERTHPTALWWRDQGGGRVRYPSKEELSPYSETPLDPRRLPCEGVYGWLRMDKGVEMFPIVRAECERRNLRFGIHTSWEEAHWCGELVSNWTLRHPEYWSCGRDGTPWLGTCSIAYPEVVEHKLRRLDERLQLGGDTIYLDLLRRGGWYPNLEYVKPVTDEWRRLYACEPPKDWTDPRWLAIVSRHVNGYLRRFATKCHEKGVKFVLGINRVRVGEEFVWAREFTVDWKGLAEDGSLDGLVVMTVRPDWADAWGSTRRIYEYVMANRGKAKVYFPVSMYDFSHFGIPTYVRETGLSAGEVTKRLYELAWDVGGAGVVFECVDYENYTPEMNEVLADTREAK